MITALYFLYDYVVLPAIFVFFYVVSLVNPKVKRGLTARRNLFEKIVAAKKKFDPAKKTIWFHSSSMGEFEQAKPIIEKLKSEIGVNIAVTFFSPSGYENSKNYKSVDLVTYIPLDTKKNCDRFIDTLQPDIAVFMRYDIWPNMVNKLYDKKVISFIADATLRSDSNRKLPFAETFHKHLYSRITKILTVSDEDAANFSEFDLEKEKLKVVGDTRFDRVYQKSLTAKDKKLFNKEFIEGKKVIVLGSSWEADEEVMIPALSKLIKQNENILLIIVPHEPTNERIAKLEKKFNGSLKTIRFSSFNNYTDERIILIDSIGLLLSLYYYADIAYVGGSFKQGVHNVLEPAVYGIPVLFGPKIQNSQEAHILVSKGSGVIIRNKEEAYNELNKLLNNNELRQELGSISYEFVSSSTGATERIVNEIYSSLK